MCIKQQVYECSKMHVHELVNCPVDPAFVTLVRMYVVAGTAVTNLTHMRMFAMTHKRVPMLVFSGPRIRG